MPPRTSAISPATSYNVATKLVLMHAETAIRSTTSKLLLSEGTLLLLKQPFEGYVRKGGASWEPITIAPYFARAK